ncbi:MAG: PepSY domain-containing protein [Alphaproteobacteria bacterium]|nr:PepSY domain-containing protein [Alphaproteobacteria bacterium]
MLRRLHSLPGLLAGLIVAFMATTGVVLSLQPVLDHVSVAARTDLTVAQLAQAVSTELRGVERIVHSASGAVTAYYDAGQGAAAASVDPATGAVIGAYKRPHFSRA